MASTAKNLGGRPSSFTQEIADEICNSIKVNAIGIVKLCAAHANWPSVQTIYTWFDKYPKFLEQYARAKVIQTESLVDSMYSLIEESEPEHSSKTRLLVDTIKWKACKLVPKVYGERTESKVDMNMHVTADDFVLYMNKEKSKLE